MRFARLHHVTMGLGMEVSLVACATTGDDSDVTKKDDPNGMPGDVARAVAELPEAEVLSANADGLPTFVRGELAKVLREEGALEELGRVLVHSRGAPIANVVEVDREFRRVERLAFAQILARSHDFVPGLHCHVLLTFTAARSARNAPCWS